MTDVTFDSDGEALANGYQMLEELGSGSFGVVYKAIEKATGQIVAIKHVDLESSEEDLSDIISELAVLSSCTSSPYVTQYKRAFLRRQTLWIVMEYLGGGSSMELATGEPPHANVHPMKVLFLIPKQPPPRLEGPQWSREFKDFVALCLTKEPERRPTAKELLKHKFVRSAGKVEGLQELIQRKQEYDSSNGGDRNLKYYAETLRSFNHTAAAVQGDDDWVFDTVKAFSSRKVSGYGSRKKQRLSAVRVIDDEQAQEEQQAASDGDAMEGLITEYPTTTRKVSSTQAAMNSLQQMNTRRRIPSSAQPKQPLGVNMSFGNSPSTVRQFRRVSPNPVRNNSRENKPSEENQDPSSDNSKAIAPSTPTKMKQVVVGATASAIQSIQTLNGNDTGESKRNAVAKLAEAWSDLEAIDPEGVYAIMTAVLGRMQQDAKLATLLPARQQQQSSSSSSAPTTAASSLAKPTTSAAKLVLSQNNPHLKSHRRRQSTQAIHSASSSPRPSPRPSPAPTREPSRVWSAKAGGDDAQAADELKGWHAGKLDHTRQLSEVLFERWVDGVKGRWGGV
ncbi:hypothetical protein DV738_g4543, partial [Chaetothyriales sp. CBS 135597]